MSAYVNLERQPGPSPHAAAARKNDPFYIVKSKVEGMIARMGEDFEKWKTMLETTNTANNRDFSSLTSSLKLLIKKLNVDINDLAQTIKIVSDNRQRFRDISDQELDSRKKFVNDMRAVVEECTEAMSSARSQRKIEADKRDQLLARSPSPGSPAASSAGSAAAAAAAPARAPARQSNDFVDSKQQAQSQLEARQDVVLDDMSSALGRLQDAGQGIHTELDDQNRVLNDFNDDMDDTSSRMNIVLGKIDKLLAKSDKGRWCCIFILLAGMFGMIFGLIYG